MEDGFPIQKGIKRPAKRDSSASRCCCCSTAQEVRAGSMATVGVDEHCTGERARIGLLKVGRAHRRDVSGEHILQCLCLCLSECYK